MFEVNLLSYWFFFVTVVNIFLISFIICRHYNALRTFQNCSTCLALLIPIGSILLKLGSDHFYSESLFMVPTCAYSFVLTVRILDLAFGFNWNYVKHMSIKLILLYIVSFPKMPTTVTDLEKETFQKENRQYGFTVLIQGGLEYTLLHWILQWIPPDWLTMSMSSLSIFICCVRYATLSVLLYLWLSSVTNMFFGLTQLIMNDYIYRMFPKFPFTSVSLREFWSYRWNIYVKSLLHRTTFVVVPNIFSTLFKISKSTSALLAAMLSGFLHEYVFWFLTGRWSGKNFIFFFLHGLLVRLEKVMNIKSLHPILGWFWTFCVIFVTSPLFFDPWIESKSLINIK